MRAADMQPGKVYAHPRTGRVRYAVPSLSIHKYEARLLKKEDAGKISGAEAYQLALLLKHDDMVLARTESCDSEYPDVSASKQRYVLMRADDYVEEVQP